MIGGIMSLATCSKQAGLRDCLQNWIAHEEVRPLVLLQARQVEHCDMFVLRYDVREDSCWWV